MIRKQHLVHNSPLQKKSIKICNFKLLNLMKKRVKLCVQGVQLKRSQLAALRQLPAAAISLYCKTAIDAQVGQQKQDRERRVLQNVMCPTEIGLCNFPLTYVWGTTIMRLSCVCACMRVCTIVTWHKQSCCRQRHHLHGAKFM